MTGRPPKTPRGSVNDSQDPKDWRPKFLEGLKERGVIQEGCDRAGISRSLFKRTREVDPIFAAEVENAIDMAIDKLEVVAFNRARLTSDKLLMFLLSSRRPEVYGRHETVDLRADVQSNNQSVEVNYDADNLSEVLAILQAAGAVVDPGSNGEAQDPIDPEAD